MVEKGLSGFGEHLYSALSLAERAACLRQDLEQWRGADADETRATAVINRWKSQQPFSTRDWFEKRLRQDGLTEQDLRAILELSPKVYAQRLADPPNWVRELEELYIIRRPPDDDSEFERYVEEGTNSFLWLAFPLYHEGLRRFRDRVRGFQSGTGTPFEPMNVEKLVVPHLLKTLREALELVLVLELNVARVQGRLDGKTPEARFRDFCRRLREPENQVSLGREYPVLFRWLHTKMTNWVESSVELLHRLSKDWDEIKANLAEGSVPGLLTAIRQGAGDSHRRGRTVTILEFESGFKLVYKPHSLSVDLHFDDLLQWINRLGFETPFRVIKKIDRGCYGWSQFVTHKSCSSRDEVERFYKRLGGYLAVLYVIRGTDMHHENLLAAGEFPLAVDLETLFHPEVRAEKDDPAIQAFQCSVMPVLLLPLRDNASELNGEVDMTAFGARSGQRFPGGRTFSWEKAGTDEMRLVPNVAGGLMVSRSRPRIDDQEVVAGEYIESFLAGFRAVYCLIKERRDELQEVGGLLDRFGEDEVRFVARPTAAYAGLLRPCYQPDRLRDAIDRDQVLDGLWLGVSQQDRLMRLIPFEMRDMQGGDVPVFTSRPNSRDLWTSDGERLPNFFERTAMGLVREGLSRMGERDLARQILFIRTAIASMGESAPDVRYAPALCKLKLTDGRDALQLARAVGDMLCEEVCENELHASWLGVTPGGRGGSTALRPLDPWLYEGIAGVALFLAYLSSVTGETSYKGVATKAITLVRRHLDRGKSRGVPKLNVGAFTGLGGIVYTLTHLAVLWDEASLIEEAKAIATDMPALIEEDSTLDVIGGSAGAIVVLDTLNRVSASDHLLSVALQCGARLWERQQSQGVGVGWKTDVQASQPLTGFSHGAAGIAWALLKLAAWSGDSRFRETAASAIAYERSTFVAEEANWPDFRSWPEDLPRPGCQVAWCHGAPGIGLARLDSLQHIDDRATREEIRIALGTLVKSGFGMNHSLCHGDLGNLDVLLHAAQRGDDFWWSEYGKQLAAKTMAGIAERGCICSTQTPLAPVGLMNGLAGIGYGLLRLASPGRVPSVLVMAPPPGCS